jgi:hypothetical protein
MAIGNTPKPLSLYLSVNSALVSVRKLLGGLRNCTITALNVQSLANTTSVPRNQSNSFHAPTTGLPCWLHRSFQVPPLNETLLMKPFWSL